MLIRHDTIRLLPGVAEAEFEEFMTRDLIPYISEAFKGPTRSSMADIKAQSLLKSTGANASTCGSPPGTAAPTRSPANTSSMRA
jgi:hypothetical protein